MDLDDPMEIDTTESDGLHQNNGRNEPGRLNAHQLHERSLCSNHPNVPSELSVLIVKRL